jgi:long-chain acyl-CoA synthetase
MFSFTPIRESVLDGLADSDLPLQRIYRWEKERAGAVFLTQPIGGQVRQWTWQQTLDEARRIAAWMEAQHWPKGSRIVILSKNCAWWIMSEFAIWMAGHVSVPIYPSLKAQSVRALLEHCEPVAIFIGAVDDQEMVAVGCPTTIQRISFPTAVDSSARSWKSIVDTTAPLSGHPVREADDLATIMYTSGTTGAPKGVMHRFSAFTYFASAVTRVVGASSEHRMLSYLPLAHIAERALVEASAIYTGFQIFFVDNLSTFLTDLRRTRPTVFFSVPRLLLKFQHRVLEKVPQNKLDRLLRIPLVGSLVKRRILRELGLDTVRIAASGSAPLPLSVLVWFRKIGLNLVEGYGMTETGISHTPRGGRSRPGWVGDGIPGVETKLAANGEILIRSPMNMIGYYRNPQGTEEAFDEDGFFRTGDLGEIDAEGWLKIVGRVKEQFKTSKGKYVCPTPIEKLLSVHPAIEGCCVMGSGMASAFAVVGITKESAQARAELERSLQALLDEANAQLEAHERLGFLAITDETWTVANGFLTPTIKLKRSALEESYARYFDQWAGANCTIVWHTSTRPEGEANG